MLNTMQHWTGSEDGRYYPISQNCKLFCKMSDYADRTGKRVITASSVALPDKGVKTAPSGPTMDFCAYFDGESYLTCPSSNDFNMGSDDFCIHFWYRLPSLASGVRNVLGRADSGNSESSRFLVREQYGVIWFDAYSNTGLKTIYTGAVANSSWHHIAIAKHGDVIRTFQNGSLTNLYSEVGLTFIDQTSPFCVGVAGDFRDFYSTCSIQNLVISKGDSIWSSDASFTPPSRFSEPEINEFTQLCIHVVGEEAQGNVIAEKSQGITTGYGVQYHSDFADFVYDNEHYVFYSSRRSFSNMNNVIPQGAYNFVVDLWIMHTNPVASEATVVMSDAFELKVTESDVPFFTVRGSYGSVNLFGPYVTKNVFNHYALVRSGNTVSFFINGIRQSYDNLLGTIDSANYMEVGGLLLSGDFDGKIKNIRIHTNTDLGWSSGFTPPELIL